MLLIISSIITCLWIILFAAIIEHTLNAGGNEDEEVRFLSCVDGRGWIQAVVLGVLVGLCNYFGSKGLGFSIAAFTIITAVLIYIAGWFFNDVDRWREWFLYVLMTIPIGWVLLQAGAGIAESITSVFWISFWMTIPKILMAIFGAFLLITLLFRKYEKTQKKPYRVIAWILLILAIIGLISQVIWGGINWKSLKKAPEPEPEPVVEVIPTPEPEPVVEEPWYHFYNLEMLLDDDAKNDFNFGPDVLEPLFLEKIKNGELEVKDIANKSIDELIDMVSPEEVNAEFRRRMEEDVALGATYFAWTDVNAKTRYLGVFYEACEENWATTMNEAKVKLMEDKELYDRTLAASYAFYEGSLESIEIVHVKGGLNDQMYMNPYTVDEIPDIIVMESAEQKGYFLRYNLDIKGTKVHVDFRIDCGFQPTNVAKLMKIEPQKNPNKPSPTPTPDPGKPAGGGPEPTGKPAGGDPGNGKPAGGDPGSTPTTVPVPKATDKGLPEKDVKNDNPGPGPDTNNGVGAIYSKEEQPTNSIFETYEEYKEDIKELKEVNKTQKVGGNPNVPTVPAPEGTGLVDSNADVGTGFGGIDVKTPIHETHVESNLGTTGTGTGSNTTSDDPVGIEWGGPPD